MSISQEIDSKINIVELVWRYLNIKKAWTNYKALCPFHNEKTPSFVISPTKNIAYCFSCHNWWWPVKFLSEIEKIPYWEAVQKLAKEAWIELKTDYYKEKNENKKDLYEMHKYVANYYHQELLKWENKSKLDYLLGRWLNLETIRNFKIWFADNWRDLFYDLKKQWYEEKDIIESWIYVSAFRDKFFGRIIFPISDYVGNIVAFTGRVLDNSLPKYLNSPTTKIFDKSSILFWLSQAKQDISKKWYVIIVEWQMDVISMHQSGFTNTVAISWTALTDEQIKLLKRITKNIYLCLDNDTAWINATFSSLENMINEEVEIKIIDLWEYKDPDEILKKWLNFEDFIKNALSPVSYIIQKGSNKYDLSSIQGKKWILKDIFIFLKKINSKIEIDSYIREIWRKLDLSVDVLYEEFKNIKLPKSEKIEKKEGAWFNFFEELVWYMTLYNYFDLFFENFWYNTEEISQLYNWTILQKTLLLKEGIFEDSSVDIEKIKTIEVYIEEQNSTLNKETIKKKFIDLVKNLEKSIFQKEKEKIEEEMKNNPTNLEIFEKYTKILKKWKEMKIIT